MRPRGGTPGSNSRTAARRRAPAPWRTGHPSSPCSSTSGPLDTRSDRRGPRGPCAWPHSGSTTLRSSLGCARGAGGRRQRENAKHGSHHVPLPPAPRAPGWRLPTCARELTESALHIGDPRPDVSPPAIGCEHRLRPNGRPVRSAELAACGRGGGASAPSMASTSNSMGFFWRAGRESIPRPSGSKTEGDARSNAACEAAPGVGRWRLPEGFWMSIPSVKGAMLVMTAIVWFFCTVAIREGSRSRSSRVSPPKPAG